MKEYPLVWGHTDFSQTALEGWEAQGGVRFIFGTAAHEKVRGFAESVREWVWERLWRRSKHEVRVPSGILSKGRRIANAYLVATGRGECF